jgi:hypothetical protein
MLLTDATGFMWKKEHTHNERIVHANQFDNRFSNLRHQRIAVVLMGNKNAQESVPWPSGSERFNG